MARLRRLEDPQLRSLVSSMKKTVLRSRANSTCKKYIGAFGRWKRWADSKGEITTFPILPHQFALYLQDIAGQSGSKSAVQEAVNAASWVQQLAGLESIGHHPLVRTVLAGLQKELAKPKKKKEPITVEILERMSDSAGENPSLSDSRLLALCLLAFTAFLRFNEAIRVRCYDITFEKDHLSLKILSSKTDQYREGDVVVVARSSSSICAVRRLEQYYKLANIDHTSTEKLFRAVSNTKNGQKLRKSGSLSYTRVRELLWEKLDSLGLESTQFGTHSFRAGGATLAANKGVPDRMFKRHGRWKSDSAKDGYVKDTLQDRLKVTQILNM